MTKNETMKTGIPIKSGTRSKDVGLRLKKSRHCLNLSKYYVANYMSMSVEELVDIEEGKEFFTDEELNGFSELYGVNREELLYGNNIYKELLPKEFKDEFNKLSKQDQDEIIDIIKCKKKLKKYYSRRINSMNSIAFEIIKNLTTNKHLYCYPLCWREDRCPKDGMCEKCVNCDFYNEMEDAFYEHQKEMAKTSENEGLVKAGNSLYALLKNKNGEWYVLEQTIYLVDYHNLYTVCDGCIETWDFIERYCHFVTSSKDEANKRLERLKKIETNREYYKDK